MQDCAAIGAIGNKLNAESGENSDTGDFYYPELKLFKLDT